MRKILGTALILIGAAGMALAANPHRPNHHADAVADDPPTPVPEIAPSAGAAALIVLSGTLLVLRARRV